MPKMPRRIRRKRDRLQAAWEQKLREKALKDLRRTMRREWRERLAALAANVAPRKETDDLIVSGRRHQRV